MPAIIDSQGYSRLSTFQLCCDDVDGWISRVLNATLVLHGWPEHSEFASHLLLPDLTPDLPFLRQVMTFRRTSTIQALIDNPLPPSSTHACTYGTSGRKCLRADDAFAISTCYPSRFPEVEVASERWSTRPLGTLCMSHGVSPPFLSPPPYSLPRCIIGPTILVQASLRRLSFNAVFVPSIFHAARNCIHGASQSAHYTPHTFPNSSSLC